MIYTGVRKARATHTHISHDLLSKAMPLTLVPTYKRFRQPDPAPNQTQRRYEGRVGEKLDKQKI